MNNEHKTFILSVLENVKYTDIYKKLYYTKPKNRRWPLAFFSFIIDTTRWGLIRKLLSKYFNTINDLTRACLITLHSNFEIFQKGHPAVEVILDRRIFER